MDEKNPLNTSDFLEERIKSRPRNRRRIARRMLEVAMFAVLFGLIACFTIVLLSPILEKRLFPASTSEVSFQDEVLSYTSEEMQPEDMILEDKEEEVKTTIIVEEPDVEARILETAYYLREKAAACDSWLVQVTGVSSEVSWLESVSTSSNTASGAVVADNGTELLILTDRSSVFGADKIEITFADGTVSEAYLKGEDLDTGLAVAAVLKTALGESTLKKISAVQMASSNTKSLPGSVVLAVGNPNGINGSVNYGFVTASGIEVNRWDINYRLVMTDMYGTVKPNGFLVNLHGQLVGVLCNDFNAKDAPNALSAIGISELKKRIEHMSNAEMIAQLGVKGTDVTEKAHEEQAVPYGAYIRGVKLNSPAMKAGIQAGDIIVRIGETDIASMSNLTEQLQLLQVGSTVDVTIVRQSQGVYKESVLNIVLGNQN